MDPNRLLGRSNPAVKRVRELRRARALRESEGVFVAEGLHLAAEALASGGTIELAVVSPRVHRVAGGPELVRRLEDARVPLARTSDATLDGVQDARSAQPVLLVVRRPSPPADPIAVEGARTPLILVALGVQDPGNLGSMWRTADAAGATSFVACGDSADLYHPRTVRATMGAVFRLPATVVDVAALLDRLAAGGVAAIGADAAAGQAYDRVDMTGPTALFLGGEGAGLPPEVAERLDAAVRIPMHGPADSLSVGAATAVLLFEAARQRA